MNKKVVVIVILVILIIGIAVGAYFILNMNGKAQVNPCASYTDTSSNISRECILHMWKNVAGCSNSLASNQLAYYEQITKPTTASPVTINGTSVAAGAKTLGQMTNDAKLWASLSTMMHRDACYGTDMSKWPKNLLVTQADYDGYTDRTKAFDYTNVKAIGAFIKINNDVTDTDRVGIIMGNPVTTTASTPSPTAAELRFDIMPGRKPRLMINDGTTNIDWTINDTIPKDTWTHIAVVLRNDKIDYYKNGSFIETRQGTPSVLTKVLNMKFGWDNRPKTGSPNPPPYPPRFQLSNLLISQGANSVDWSNEQVANIFANYKPAV